MNHNQFAHCGPTRLSRTASTHFHHGTSTHTITTTTTTQNLIISPDFNVINIISGNNGIQMASAMGDCCGEWIFIQQNGCDVLELWRNIVVLAELKWHAWWAAVGGKWISSSYIMIDQLVGDECVLEYIIIYLCGLILGSQWCCGFDV